MAEDKWTRQDVFVVIILKKKQEVLVIFHNSDLTLVHQNSHLGPKWTKNDHVQNNNVLQ